MTAIELARLVQEMRAAQKAYFRERTPARLEESKALERDLDRTVEEILSDQPAMLPGFGGHT